MCHMKKCLYLQVLSYFYLSVYYLTNTQQNTTKTRLSGVSLILFIGIILDKVLLIGIFIKYPLNQGDRRWIIKSSEANRRISVCTSA